jgi:crossover junction endodeoxyribonuclease RusA
MTAEALRIAPEPLLIELSWPAKELSPNVSVHPMVLSRFKKAAKKEAGWATRIARPFTWVPPDGPIAVGITAYPPKNWGTGDKDNFVSRLKFHLDSIAEVIGVNDRQFESPVVKWADKTERGKVVIRISEAA